MIKLPSQLQDLMSRFTSKPSDAEYDQGRYEDGQPQMGKFQSAIAKTFALDLRLSETGRYFSGGILEKAITAIDKSTTIIIAAAWIAAAVSVGLAFIAVRDTAQLKLKADVARALEPVLPKVARLPLSKEQYDPLVQRLKKQFPTVTFDVSAKPTLRITSNNPDDFISWLNSVSYVDSMVSTIRWTLTNFCVGSECPGEGVMQAELTAEAINIAQQEQPR